MELTHRRCGWRCRLGGCGVEDRTRRARAVVEEEVRDSREDGKEEEADEENCGGDSPRHSAPRGDPQPWSLFACNPRPAVRRAVRAVLPTQSRPDECSLGVDSDGRSLISSSTAALLRVVRLHPTHSRKDAAYVSLFARRPCTRVMLSELVRDNTCL